MNEQSASVTRHEKRLARLMSGTADRSFPFDELCATLRSLGFEERRGKGSHRIFFRAGVAEILNLQPSHGGVAKPYQVRQARDVSSGTDWPPTAKEGKTMKP